MADETMMRTLRAAAQRAKLVDALVATWATVDTSDAVRVQLTARRGVLLAGVPSVWVRNTTRHIARFVSLHGRVPSGLTELEEPPHPGAQLPLGSGVDNHYACLHGPYRPGRSHLDILLPVCENPTAREHWVWHRLDVAHRADVPTPFTLPTLRVANGVLHVDLLTRVDVPDPQIPDTVTKDAPLRVFGVDWGVRRMLTGRILDCHEEPDPNNANTLVADIVGAPVFIDPAGLVNKWHRLRVTRERLHTKAAHIEALCDGHTAQGCTPDPVLVARAVVLRTEADRVTVKQRRLGVQIGNVVARLALEHARACGAHVIAVEDLRSLEPPRCGGKRVRSRISQQLRSQVFDKLAAAAAAAGVGFVVVDARGTSSQCVACGATVTHVASPDGGVGYTWARCGCGVHGDRDVVASGAVGVRGANVVFNKRAGRKKQPKGATAPSVKKQARRAPARVRLGRSDVRLPKPAPMAVTRRGRAIPHARRDAPSQHSSSCRVPCGPGTAAPDLVAAGSGTPFAAAGHPAPPPPGEEGAVPGPTDVYVGGHNVGGFVAVCDGTRFAYRRMLRATPVPLRVAGTAPG